MLRKAVIKLAADSLKFHNVLKGVSSAAELVAKLEQNNSVLMTDSDVSNERKKVWMKTLVDIKSLVNAGAMLVGPPPIAGNAQYGLESDW